MPAAAVRALLLGGEPRERPARITRAITAQCEKCGRDPRRCKCRNLLGCAPVAESWQRSHRRDHPAEHRL